MSPYQHSIVSSQYSLGKKTIKRVSGYGYKDEPDEILTTIVFEMEDKVVTIATGPIIEVRINEHRPDNLGDFIYSF